MPLRALSNATLLQDPVTDSTGAFVTLKKEQVGPISTETQYYAQGSISVTQPYPAADLLLTPLVNTGGRAIRG